MGYKKYFLLAVFLVIIGSLTYFYFGYKKDMKLNSIEGVSQTKITSIPDSEKGVSQTKITSIPDSVKVLTYLSSLNGEPFKEFPSLFFIDNKNLYFFNKDNPNEGHLILEDVNYSTFKAISKEYGTDGVKVFYKNKIVKDADPTSFYVLVWCGIEGIDNNHIYSQENIIRSFTNRKSIPSKNVGKSLWSVGDC